MARPVFGRPETGRPEYVDPLAAVRLSDRNSGHVLELCAPPIEPAFRRRFLELVQARGWPCHRCIANEAPAGAPPRCHFTR